MRVKPSELIRGTITPPPDKSITHRALIVSSMGKKESTFYNLLDSADTRRTFDILKKLGIRFKGDFRRMEIIPSRISVPDEPLFCGNSGTTARLMMGFLASKEGTFFLYGDRSLSRRPMKRVMEPLEKMGVRFLARDDGYLPLALRGGKLSGIKHVEKLGSAQVKSAIILAALKADGPSTIVEKKKSRDHTERMVKAFRGCIKVTGDTITIEPSELESITMKIPGDFSSAAFFIVLGVLHKNARLVIENVNLNPTRTGLLDVLKSMGANLEVTIVEDDIEPVGRVVVETSKLVGTEVKGSIVPKMIDELPLVALLGVFAEGETVVRDAEELRKKESDRIKAVVRNFRTLGVEIEELEDGFKVEGPQRIRGGRVDPMGDHRMAMLFSIAGALSEEGVEVKNHNVVSISFPDFFKTLKMVTGGSE